MESNSQTRPSGLRYEVRDGVALLTLDRPGRGNGLTVDLGDDLARAWAAVRDDPAIRVAIMTGSGDRHFCTGADVGTAEFAGDAPRNDGPYDQDVRYTARQNSVWKPVICAVNGLVAGAGLHFVVDADIVLAAETVAFMDTHVSVGQIGAIENIGLTRRLPLGSALRMTLMGKHYRMPAQRAYQLGLVDEVYPVEELLPAADEMARLMMQGSPRAMAVSQEALWKSLDMGYTQATDLGWALVRSHWNHPDVTEGPKAYTERRQPQWQPPRAGRDYRLR
ncbi:enoyl-CoA hydratase/isomerase family protein [Mycobacterium intracellulare]|uniref:Enoyl-CoA hydratase/carnithine racemase n=1 Tax=Mycobacterium intracellulare subsp. chimaera TaxID=222805 RepID=A0A7U5MPU4_MYCIT|nr:enoyl-CoA hydratase/isomerase family protein [Mycobacterium intracellulare]ASL17532.1 enoyl-CoA hydratase/carnithine racemase [Mycobacterium intracellulare subsp. chimaera]